MTETTEIEITGLAIAKAWPVAMLMGLITLALGVIVMSWPQETLVVLSVLLGLQLLIGGVYGFISAFATDAVSPGWQGVIGVLGVIAGIVVLRNPFETVEVLVVLLGIVWILSGLLDIVSSIADRQLPYRGLLAVRGLVSLAAGVVVVAWPAPTVTVVAWIAGFYLIVYGLVFCVEAWQLRRLTT